MSRINKIPVKIQKELHQVGNLKWNPTFEAEITDANDAIGWAKLDASYDNSLRRYVCTSMTVERAGEGTDITGATLRDMRIAETIQLAALDNIWVETAVISISGPIIKVVLNGEEHVSAADALKALPIVSGRTTDTDARNATIAYSIAQVSGMPVLRTISKSLETSQSTAQRLVARARTLEYLDG